MADVPADFGGSIPEFSTGSWGLRTSTCSARSSPGACPPGRPATSSKSHAARGSSRGTCAKSEAGCQSRRVGHQPRDARLRKRQAAAARGVEWREADACKLPFGNAAFGAVVCAFGVMFVPDKAACFREARRVLRKGGTFLFNVWDGLDNNPHGRVAAEVIEGSCRATRRPASARFPTTSMTAPRLPPARGCRVRRRAHRHRAHFVHVPSAREFAIGQLRGTPRSLILQERGIPVDGVIEKVAAALARLGGAEPFRYTAQALVVEARAI